MGNHVAQARASWGPRQGCCLDSSWARQVRCPIVKVSQASCHETALCPTRIDGCRSTQRDGPAGNQCVNLACNSKVCSSKMCGTAASAEAYIKGAARLAPLGRI